MLVIFQMLLTYVYGNTVHDTALVFEICGKFTYVSNRFVFLSNSTTFASLACIIGI